MSKPSKFTRQNSWRDSFAPFTEEELNYVRNVVFPSMPSYEGETVSTADFQLGCNQIKWQRTTEVMKAY